MTGAVLFVVGGFYDDDDDDDHDDDDDDDDDYDLGGYKKRASPDLHRWQGGLVHGKLQRKDYFSGMP